ncbi:MAG: hypothetical protein ACI90V_005398, partial [Bacillariaceae sp.]|jgi:hypothetical protein
VSSFLISKINGCVDCVFVFNLLLLQIMCETKHVFSFIEDDANSVSCEVALKNKRSKEYCETNQYLARVEHLRSRNTVRVQCNGDRRTHLSHYFRWSSGVARI